MVSRREDFYLLARNKVLNPNILAYSTQATPVERSFPVKLTSLLVLVVRDVDGRFGYDHISRTKPFAIGPINPGWPYPWLGHTRAPPTLPERTRILEGGEWWGGSIAGCRGSSDMAATHGGILYYVVKVPKPGSPSPVEQPANATPLLAEHRDRCVSLCICECVSVYLPGPRVGGGKSIHVVPVTCQSRTGRSDLWGGGVRGRPSTVLASN